jgi:hypothetical protein
MSSSLKSLLQTDLLIGCAIPSPGWPNSVIVADEALVQAPGLLARQTPHAAYLFDARGAVGRIAAGRIDIGRTDLFDTAMATVGHGFCAGLTQALTTNIKINNHVLVKPQALFPRQKLNCQST